MIFTIFLSDNLLNAKNKLLIVSSDILRFEYLQSLNTVTDNVRILRLKLTQYNTHI